MIEGAKEVGDFLLTDVVGVAAFGTTGWGVTEEAECSSVDGLANEVEGWGLGSASESVGRDEEKIVQLWEVDTSSCCLPETEVFSGSARGTFGGEKGVSEIGFELVFQEVCALGGRNGSGGEIDFGKG